MADVERDAALARILVEEIAAHVGILDPRQWPRRLIACLAAADRRHPRQPRVGIVLPFDLVALRAHRREKARAARGGEKPGEIENLDALERERLVVQRRAARVLDLARLGGNAGLARSLAEHGLRVLTQKWRAAADLPARLAAKPFRGRVGERTPELGMLDFGKGLARPPMLVERVFVRLAQRRPEQPGILRLKPRHVLES